MVLGNLSFKYPNDTKGILNPETAENSESPYFNRKNISDGPYIFYEKNQIEVKWVHRNYVVGRTIRSNNFKVIKRKFGFDFNPEWIKQNNTNDTNYIQKYEHVKNLVAISDIHGQYDVFVKLLKKHHVIDKDFNWIFGKGHLVVLGDVFDRGPKVTESLWLIYRLEQQAKESGGMVHFLLGNHEIMVLSNDTRYINEKYLKSAELMNKSYSQLYAANTFLGKWLRKKPIMVSINDMLFVHAGISNDFINNGFTKTKTNKLFSEGIVGKSWDNILNNNTLSFLMSEKGPVWYRGYFVKPYLTEFQIDNSLKYFDAKHIIVGHTSMPNIISLFHNKIFDIDSGIQYGDYGEVLIYNNGRFYRGTISGSLIEI